MSLYNLLFGKNRYSDILMGILELNTKYKIGRFRDIYLNKYGTKIILYTRNGGGNRDHYNCDDYESKGNHDCDCTGCIMTYQIPSHPNYLDDYDDEMDCTYAYIKYSIPEKYSDLCFEMLDGKEPESIKDKFEKIFNFHT